MKKAILLVLSGAVVVWAIIYAPGYLVRSDVPEKSQVVVLFIGAEFVPRKQEAFKLVADGYARYLITPAYGRVSDAGLFENSPAQLNARLIKGIKRARSDAVHYPWYYGDTHVEVLEAKRMMDKAGFTSALFVSSPYHMRRLGLITKEVFREKKYRILFIASRFQRQGSKAWLLNRRDLKYVGSEYFKIAWFRLYSLFAQT